MRILIDSDNSACGNMGDVAMLQVTVRRLRALFPAAKLEVLSDAPELLARHCAHVETVPATGRYTWVGDDYVLGRLHRLLPAATTRALGGAKRALARRWPGPMRALVGGKARLRRVKAADPAPFVEALGQADLYVVSGLGALTDSAREHSTLVLDTAALAADLGIPVVWFSQGVGPCRDAGLLGSMRAVLPRASLIAVRERRQAPERLRRLGVAAERIAADAGDDAVELAWEGRRAQPGTAVGVNVRVARYAGIDRAAAERWRVPIDAFARRHGAPLVPLPITRHPRSSDADTLRALFPEQLGDGGLGLDTPERVIAAAGGCRMVVTGAYHAAVFALAQGVPAVCLAGSEYYEDKFAGLADLFGPGCTTVNTAAGPGALLDAMERTWACAEAWRAGLLAAAERQIESGRAVYARVADLSSQRSLHVG
jgi:polysaccharide pyruvyl transferase WcaK-like protein